MSTSGLDQEWSVLQNQFDSYEKYSLLIKLASIAVLCAAYFSDHISGFVLFLLLVLWGQDAIWKTFQSRIEPRLLQIEEAIRNESAAAPYQFNSEYQKTRGGLVRLVGEYVRQAFRPTVVFPHVVLMLMLGFELVYYRTA